MSCQPRQDADVDQRRTAVDRAGHAHPDAEQLAHVGPGVAGRPRDHSGGLVQRRGAVHVDVDGRLELGQHAPRNGRRPPPGCDRARCRPRRPRPGGVASAHQQRRPPAAALVRRPAVGRLDDMARCDQVADQAGHGGAGQPGAAGEIGPAERARPQQVRHSTPIGRAELLEGVAGHGDEPRPIPPGSALKSAGCRLFRIDATKTRFLGSTRHPRHAYPGGAPPCPVEAAVAGPPYSSGRSRPSRRPRSDPDHERRCARDARGRAAALPRRLAADRPARAGPAGPDDPRGEGRPDDPGRAWRRRGRPVPRDHAGKLGSVLSGGGSVPADNTPAGWADMVDSLQARRWTPGCSIPLIYGVDSVHGHGNLYGATVFPHNIGLGATRDPQLVERIGRLTAEETRATGPQWTFAPCVCVARDDRWGRTYECFGENPGLVSKMETIIDGLQGGRGIWTTPTMCSPRPSTSPATASRRYGTADRMAATRSTRASTVDRRRTFAQARAGAVLAGRRQHDVGTVMPSFSSVDWTEDGLGNPVKMHAQQGADHRRAQGRHGLRRLRDLRLAGRSTSCPATTPAQVQAGGQRRHRHVHGAFSAVRPGSFAVHLDAGRTGRTRATCR